MGKLYMHNNIFLIDIIGYENTHLTASFPGQPGQAGTKKVKPVWILIKQEMMRWQWHQLDHMLIMCTLLQTDNHASTSSLIFYRPNALPDAQPTVSNTEGYMTC